jgi:hypothetical protein
MKPGRWLVCGCAVLGICVLAGCASGTTRYRMASDEGIYIYTDEAGVPPEQLLDAINGWVGRYFNAQKITFQKDKDNAGFVLQGWAPVQVDGEEQLVQYRMLGKLKDKKYRLQFETGSLANGFYPAPANLSQLESYYGKIRDALKTDLAAKADKF